MGIRQCVFYQDVNVESLFQMCLPNASNHLVRDIILSYLVAATVLPAKYFIYCLRFFGSPGSRQCHVTGSGQQNMNKSYV